MTLIRVAKFSMTCLVLSFFPWTGAVSLSSSRIAHSSSSIGGTRSSFLGSIKFKLLDSRKSAVSSFSFQRTSPVMMPEGPEVRTLVDQLQYGIGQRLIDLKFISGRYSTQAPPIGFEAFRNTMTYYKAKNKNGEKITNVDIITDWKCKGKFIYMTLDDGSIVDTMTDLSSQEKISNSDFLRSIWITLGMTGRFGRDGAPTQASKEGSHSIHKQPRWYFEFMDENEPIKPSRRIYYYDTRNFGTLKFSLSKRELEEKLKSLGPDILNAKECTEEVFFSLVRKQRPSMNICKFLMDQSKISGIGNYILSEGLYRSKIDPFASIDEISDEQIRILYNELIDVVYSSYKSQGVTRRGGSYRDVDGNDGKYYFSLRCYGKEVTEDGEIVLRDTNGPHGRTIWYVESQLFMPRSARNDVGKVKSSESNTQSAKEPPNSSADLIQYLYDASWKTALSSFLKSEQFERLSKFVESERKVATVYPPREDTFAALNTCPFDRVRVVIIGQDPYHGPGQGHGLAFSVQKGVKLPPSLQNIFKELVQDEGISYPPHGNLESWTKQGVLLLNTVLTVRQGEANSHSSMGWENFTDEVVEVLNEKKKGLVFLLWGSPAAKKGKTIDRRKHTVIETSHPSPLGATKTNSPFIGSKCFSRCNQALIVNGYEAINWNIPK